MPFEARASINIANPDTMTVATVVDPVPFLFTDDPMGISIITMVEDTMTFDTMTSVALRSP